MEQVKCFIPETLEEALRIRKETGATVLAGGSDLMVANSMGAGVTPAFKGDVLIITNLKELKGIRALPDGSVEIGACTTSAEIARSPIAPELLKDAASRMGAIALRNSATIGEVYIGRIRKLTPRECWKLQGFTDGQFDKANATGLSDSRLYKMAGNAVTVNVISEIGKIIKKANDKN